MQHRKEELDFTRTTAKVRWGEIWTWKKERLLKLENEKQEKQLIFKLLKKCSGDRL